MVQNGLDRLAGSFADKFRGFRVGLVANSASIAADGTPAWDVLRQCGFEMTCLFAPEHGARLEHGAGKRFSSYRDDEVGLDVRSLYDERRRIDSASFRDVDLILFDLPQVGCRFYTYVHTLIELLRHAHRSGIPLVVLDRPNPIRADVVEGPLPRGTMTSPFGPDRLPVRYGLTLGEVARAFVARHRLQTHLTVLQMEGYRRAMWFDETGLPWRPTSPNMRSLDAVILYPGSCLFEGTTLSEGRGTDYPFEQFGAPWLDHERLVDRLQELALPGIAFETVEFEPTESKHAGVLCAGVRASILDRNEMRPLTAFISVIAEIRRLHGDVEFWSRDPISNGYFMDLLFCDDRVRRTIDRGAGVETLLSSFDEAARQFASERQTYLAYRDE